MEQKTVKWFLDKKSPPLIKFNDDDNDYRVTQNVVDKSDFIKFPIKKGDIVEVTIEKEEVTFLKKTEATKGDVKEEKKPEVKLEEPKKEIEKPEANTEIKKPEVKQEEPPVVERREVTIYAVSGNKEVIKFTKEGAWVKVAKELQTADYKTLGLFANHNTVVTLTNGVITNAECTKKEDVKEEKKPEINSVYNKASDITTHSIEKQVALKEAGAIVRAYIESKHEGVKSFENAGELLIKLTKYALKALNEA